MPDARSAPKKFELHRFPLFRWFLSQAGFADWDAARDLLSDAALEQRAPDGSSQYLQLLQSRAAAHRLSREALEKYDAAILANWDEIARRRVSAWGSPRLKYFQYLCLIAVEHVLTRFGDDAPALLHELNAASGSLAYDAADLRKLALSIATGAGKTLLMHVNLKQWMRLVGRDSVESVILVTPSELLSRHHLAEMRLSGIAAALFDPQAATLFDDDADVKIIDINKLRETRGSKTVAVESFGTRNLVLIDEAHRGSRSEDRVWKEYRDRLSADGYAFEYSATFRQAIAASGESSLVEEYERSIVFDYPYRAFYNDGFGKDFRVRNAEFADTSEEAALYFVAALLVFYQQRLAFAHDREAAKQSGIDAPLLLAVGTTVQKTDSDVENILLRLRGFIEDREASVERIERLLRNESALVTTNGQPVVFFDLDLLRGSFAQAGALYDGLRRDVFHAGAGGSVRMTRFSAVQGEILVSVDTAAPFALINVGDAAPLFTHVTRTLGFAADESTGGAADAKFDGVSKQGSCITVLIGARKFLEGWDSNRPSSMLLLNVGRSEGSQIMQLFGRGVRLRGYEGSLSRSSRDLYRPAAPKTLHYLETLEIFGIRADYINRFKSVLEVEGLRKTFDASRSVQATVRIPTGPRLKILRSEGPSYAERHPEVVFDPRLDDCRVTLDWYARILSYSSGPLHADAIERRTAALGGTELSFLDFERVYAVLLAQKRSRRLNNVVIPRRSVDDLFAKADWYTLYASEESLRPVDMGSIRTWQKIAEALACAYLSEWYRRRLREHEATRLRLRELGADDPAIVTEYVVHYDGADERVDDILAGSAYRRGDALEMLRTDWSVYDPLVYVSDRGACATVPAALVKSERDFVADLVRFIGSGALEESGASIHLMRNAGRGRGIGFAEAANFHPDFILWFCRGDAQVVMFVEPHGLAHELLGFAGPKVAFSKTIVGIESRLNDPSVKLAAAIVSPTPRENVRWAADAERSELDDYNVFFFEDTGYIARLVQKGLDKLDETRAAVP